MSSLLLNPLLLLSKRSPDLEEPRLYLKRTLLFCHLVSCLKASFSVCCCHAPTARQHITVCIVTFAFVTISSQICSCQNGTSTANVELQKYKLNCKCGAASVSCYLCSSTANVSTAYVAGRICVNCKKVN